MSEIERSKPFRWARTGLAKPGWLTEVLQKFAAVRFDMLEITMAQVHFTNTERIILVFLSLP